MQPAAALPLIILGTLILGIALGGIRERSAALRLLRRLVSIFRPIPRGSNMSDLTDAVAKLKTDIESFIATHTAVTNDNAAKDAQIADLTGKLNEANTELAALKAEHASVVTNVNATDATVLAAGQPAAPSA